MADDSDHTCADGFQYTVTITSGAPDGTDVTLYDGSSLLKTAQVSGGTASFAVQLATSGTAQQLSIQYPSTAACNVTENVTVSCPNSPPDLHDQRAGHHRDAPRSERRADAAGRSFQLGRLPLPGDLRGQHQRRGRPDGHAGGRQRRRRRARPSTARRAPSSRAAAPPSA